MSLTQRLLGAAVLIALAVIFVPMWLDGSGREEPVNRNMDIPPEPEYSFEPPAAPPPKPRKPAAPESPRGSAPPAVERAPEPAIAAERASEREVKPNLDEPKGPPARTAETAPAEPASAVPPEPAPPPETAIEPRPEPPAEPAPVTEEGWVVQVGSFSEQSNAAVLRDKLRAAGYDAFFERAGTGEATVYRVRVGPRPRREAAEKLQARLLAEQALKGFVTEHP